MKKVNKKKGFTLAELLVVLAILAVLVAVAIPIFTGVINNAEKRVQDANIRAVRAAGVTAILASDTERSEAGPWSAKADVTSSGSMGAVTIADWNDSSDAEKAEKQSDGSYKVTAKIEASALTIS